MAAPACRASSVGLKACVSECAFVCGVCSCPGVSDKLRKT